MIDPRQIRSILPATAVVVTALLGGFAHVTLPRMKTLSTLRAEYETLSEQAALTGRPSALPVATDAQEVTQFVKHVQAANAVIAEPNDAHDHLLDLARLHALQVESITPSRSENEGGRVDLFGWAMTATGGFAAIVEFIDALNSTPGLCRVGSMRLTPAMGTDSAALTLNLNVEFVRVHVPASLLEQGERNLSSAREEESP